MPIRRKTDSPILTVNPTPTTMAPTVYYNINNNNFGSIVVFAERFIQRLQDQHRYHDLKVYRNAHKDVRNRVLHWILIPVECWSVLAFVHLASMVILITVMTTLSQTDGDDENVDHHDHPPHHRQQQGQHGVSSSTNVIEVMAMPGILVLRGWWTVMSSTSAIATIFLGLLSVVITSHKTIGWICFVFHLACTWSIYIMLPPPPLHLEVWLDSPKDNENNQSHYHQKIWNMFVTIVICWTLAWSVQVGIGHWILERNQPNVAANLNDVSYIAMCQSVLIAWSS
jgi:hypothetical protein